MVSQPGTDEPARLEEAALLEENAEDLYERAPAGYVSSLPQGLIVKVNETLLTWLGYDRDDVVGRKRLQDLLSPGARIYYETHYAPLLLMQGDVREIAVELIRADGGRLPVLLNSTLLRDAAGEPWVVRTTVFDASERRRYERELQRLRNDAESRARAVLALEHVHDGVLLVSLEGTIDVFNPAADRILGFGGIDVVGRRLASVVPEWEELARQVPIAPAGLAASPTVVPLARRGHEQWLSVAAVDGGEGVVWTFSDVTGDRALEQMRGDLIAVVSHELRTPLTGVYGAAQTLLARYDELGDELRRQLLTVLVEQTERLTHLVDQILTASHLEAGRAEVPVRSYDARSAVEAALSAVPEAARARVEIDVAAGTSVLADPDSARQVLANVVENGLKYSDGPVRVAAVRAGDTIRFTVTDEGPGIPPGERERVFERFYRVDPDQRGGVGGVGLGLYIARQLTELLRGRIRIEAGNGGTAVVVELPAAEPAPAGGR